MSHAVPIVTGLEVTRGPCIRPMRSGDGPRQVHHLDFKFGRSARRQCCLGATNQRALQCAPLFGIIPLEPVGASLHVGGRQARHPARQQPPYKLVHVALGSFAVALGDLAHAGGACVQGQAAYRIHFSVSPGWLVSSAGELVNTFTPLPDAQNGT